MDGSGEWREEGERRGTRHGSQFQGMESGFAKTAMESHVLAGSSALWSPRLSIPYFTFLFFPLLFYQPSNFGL